MLKIGLTGGIGCGKSTAVDAFFALGIPTIDADKISKEQVAAGSETLVKISELFGRDILLKSGELNRPLLKEKIFSDADALKKLEAIVHPAIRAEILRQLSVLEKSQRAPDYVIVDIPLLVEKGYQPLFDRIIVVDCLPEQQLKRVSARDNMAIESIENIMNVQADREKRKKSATDILDNTGDADTLRAQIEILHNKLTSN